MIRAKSSLLPDEFTPFRKQLLERRFHLLICPTSPALLKTNAGSSLKSFRDRPVSLTGRSCRSTVESMRRTGNRTSSNSLLNKDAKRSLASGPFSEHTGWMNRQKIISTNRQLPVPASLQLVQYPRYRRAISAVRLSSAFVEPFAAWMERPAMIVDRYLV
jgi:hypothetical protein